jgi:Viral coat protein P2 N-terminal domain
MNFIKLNPFLGVAATGRATLVTDQLRGMSLHGLLFKRGGTTFTNAHLANINARIDGKDIVSQLTGTQLVTLNKYDGLPDVTNYTALYFGDPTARTIRGEHWGDVDFSVYQKPLELTVDTSGATAPTLEVLAITGPPKKNMGAGFTDVEAANFRALVPTTIQPAAAVSRSSYGISLGALPGAKIRKLGFFHANLTSVDLQKQSFRVWDDVAVADNSALQQQYARVPQSGLYVLDRVFDGNQGEAEDTVNKDGVPWNLQVALTTSGADTINTFADVITSWRQR